MEVLDPNNFTDLSKFLILEDDTKMVFDLPLNLEFDWWNNKDYLLSKFKDVEVKFVKGSTTQTVTCYKKPTSQ